MKNSQFDYINVIPLVDVMLVLLTIVLTTSTFIATGAIPVELPRAEQGAEGALEGISIEIDQGGKIYLDSKLILLEELGDELICMDKDMPLLIRADRRVALESFVGVLDTIRSLGFASVSLQTEKKL